MGNLFNMDNGFFSFLSKVCDILFLSIIWLIVCIPIITIGPANTALYYVTVKVIRRERGYLFREFFKSFRLNFKRAAIVGVILTIMFFVLIFDLLTSWATLGSTSTMGSVLFGVYVAITFILTCFSIYAFPVLSRFDMNIKQLLKAASFMSMRHLPSTLAMVIVTVASLAGVLLIPILIFILPAASAFINSLLMEKVLKKYMPEEEGTDENISKDEWYRE
ncbi:MAG: putative rane protein [Herbinix sp.]|jgi:uncharacterized membrane protein YesL|nr:putative rane protein [Herbinix sp.]